MAVMVIVAAVGVAYVMFNYVFTGKQMGYTSIPASAGAMPAKK